MSSFMPTTCGSALSCKPPALNLGEELFASQPDEDGKVPTEVMIWGEGSAGVETGLDPTR